MRPPVLAFSPDGTRLGVAWDEKVLTVLDVNSGAEVSRHTTGKPAAAPAGDALGLAFSPDKGLVAVGHVTFDLGLSKASGSLSVRKVVSGAEAWRAQQPDLRCTVLAFSQNGKVLAAGGFMGATLWDAAAGKLFRQLDAPGPVTLLAFSPDGHVLAGVTMGLALATPEIYLWEVATGEVRCRLRGHRGYVSCLAFAPDGARLASGGEDTTILLWDPFRLPGGAKAAPRQAESLWANLAEARADLAFAAIQEQVAAPEAAVTLLRERLRPAQAKVLDAAAIRRRIDEVGSGNFGVRDRAARELEGQGRAAAAALREALHGDLGADHRRRLERLLARAETEAFSSEELRAWRGVEVLERIGTPAAREVLRALAGGAPQARRTQEARLALRRLAKLHPEP
jgi:hypothetical protein